MQEIKDKEARDKKYLVEVVRQYNRRSDWIRTEMGFNTKKGAEEYYDKILLKQGKKYWEKKRLGRKLEEDYQWLYTDFSDDG